MKNLFLIILGLFVFASCSEDFLDTQKIGEQTVETFYQTDAQAIMAANACYAPLWHYRYVSSSFALNNIATDDAVKGSEPGDMDAITDLENFMILPSNTIINWKYPRIFEGVNKCNQVIYNLEGKEYPELTPEIQARVIAEAKFLRAFYYFDGVRTWGGLPIIEKPLQLNEMNLTRNTIAEVYDFIEADLKAAEAVLPEKSEYAAEDLGRATKGAAQALLVKVCVYQASEGYEGKDFYDASKWAEAKVWAEKLFASGEYSLYEGFYGDIFDEIGENGPESIFEIQFTETESNGDTYNNNGNFTTVFTMPRGPWGWGLMQPTYDLYAEFEQGDPRRDASITNSLAYIAEEIAYGAPATTTVSDDRTGLHNLKNYLKPNERPIVNYKNSPVNERVIRLSDVYLMYAEACYHTGDEANARLYVNKVRERARGGNNAVLPDVTASGEALLEAIYHERRVELCLENHRFFDLIRWGRLEKEVKTDGYLVGTIITEVNGEYVIESDGNAPFKATQLNMNTHWLMPIPQSEIDFTGGVITQNPGY